MSKPTATRHIGLSLGADLCWPACYEAIVQKLDLHLDLGEEVVDFAVERVRRVNPALELRRFHVAAN